MKHTEITELRKRFDGADAGTILGHFLEAYGPGERTKGADRIALATALGAEGQVLTHMLSQARRDARIFVLDTGRFHEETYEVMSRTMKRYGIQYEIYFPEAGDVEDMVRRFGPNLFYENIEFRKMCCQARKVRPLQRVLRTLDVWITGLRRDQAVTRGGLERIEWDEANGIIKLNPLADWSEEEVWEYIRAHDIPYNRLHDQGYPSIGCAPCTRKVSPGEDIRAGRWWWEKPEHRECGLHLVGGKLVGGKGLHG